MSEAFQTFVLDQLEPLGDVTARRMFGGVGLYCRGVFFGILARDTCYLKVDDHNRPDFEREGMPPFQPFVDRPATLQYYAVPLGVLESPTDLARWARRSIAAAERPRSATRRPAAAPDRLFKRPVFERARRLCLARPGTLETVSWGHPTFRAGTKIYCAFELFRGRPSIAFKLPPPRLERVLARRDAFATPYGRGQWVSLWVDGRVNWRLVEACVDASYQAVSRPSRALGRSPQARRAARGGNGLTRVARKA